MIIGRNLRCFTIAFQYRINLRIIVFGLTAYFYSLQQLNRLNAKLNAIQECIKSCLKKYAKCTYM